MTHDLPPPPTRLAVTLSAVVVVLLTGPALAQSWSSFGGDPGRSGHQPADSPVSTGAAGLPDDFRTYDLRHAHASQLIDMGASPLAIKERLGHADVLTTFRKYGHLFQGVQERLAAQLEEAHRQAVAAMPSGEVVQMRPDRRLTAGQE